LFTTYSIFRKDSNKK